MAGVRIIDDIVKFLFDHPGMEYHYTHIAGELDISPVVRVSDALNNEAKNKNPRVQRVRNGVWKAKTNTSTHPQSGSKPGMPTLLEFIGMNRDGSALFRDPDTMLLWKAEQN